MRVDLHLGESRSLKAKRAALKPIIEGARRRYGVAIAEVDHEDTWQRTCIGVAVVSNSPHHATEVVDEVERFIWSVPDVQVLGVERHWLEVDR
ncbi:MAG: DUF503 domain-containing protein [Acidimicrobiales bacterium]